MSQHVRATIGRYELLGAELTGDEVGNELQTRLRGGLVLVWLDREDVAALLFEAWARPESR